MFHPTRLAVGAAALALLAPAVTPAATIIADTFSRTGNLNGSSPDTAQNAGDQYTAAASNTTNGSALVLPTAPNTNDFTALTTASLPFTPTSGNVYTLSADLTPTYQSGTSTTHDGNGDWLAIGFLPNTTASTNASIFDGSNNAGPWALYTADGGAQAFHGPGIGTGDAYAQTVGTNTQTTTATLSIVLDTTGATYKVTDYLNGVQFGTYTFASNPAIKSVAIGDYLIGGTVDNFSVTTPATVPEPASLGLATLAGAGLLARRRRAQG